MVGDMGRSWSGYFVNVELIKVSFLHAIDAHKLIVHPIPNIFNEETAREIIYTTHCQPFLIQAVCKHIIEHLNESSREQATLEDVSASVEEVFESWGGYFWDLWDRCDVDQHSILLVLYVFKNAETDQIVEASGLGKHRTLLALQKLQMRDLVVRENGLNQLAIPMLARWIELNHHLLSSTHEQ